ncbi:MAG: signal peptidase I [Clostridia bacterium]|nr:signal peptidase I [Clostridia bacterium]
MKQKDNLSAKERNEFLKRQEEFHKKDKAFNKRANLDFFLYLLTVVLIALSIRLFIFEPYRVEGDSMVPTLLNSERLFVEKVSYWFDHPERGQVIICFYPDEKDTCVKRVIGLPGETVEVRWGVLYINGVPLDESAYWDDFIYNDMAPYTVPENSIFVVGDNRNVSKDSRAPSVGAIPYERVVGQAHFVMWPFRAWRDI